jgi:maltose alpha-D-glucosyltransferase/alpha-amylase
MSADWYKDAVIYELHIKAFRDSNADGVGDIDGLIEKLDHLSELGVTLIWLLPFFPSPLKDDGYDIADYYSIHPEYGNIPSFQKLLKEAHARNLKVIIELVINHTSDQHPWFKRAVQSPRDSSERNYYVWSDDPNLFKDARIIFQDYEKSNWSWSEEAGQYYWHRFFHHQPDLNYDNVMVQEEVFKIIDYWCKMGVNGFRLDAVPYLFEREGTNCENLPETHGFLKKLRSFVEEHYPGTLLLAEANMWPRDAVSYFGNGDECQMNFHFPLMPRMFMAIEMEDKHPVVDIYDQTPAIPDSCQWAIFLRNHDELTLEMVTDEERDYMYKSYAKDAKARINLGIRHRLAPLLDNDRRKIELMNALLFSMPGTPVIYYGDEIGMGDNFYLGDRDGVRTPMQWSPDRNAGFSHCNPQHLYLPVILDPAYHYEALNVEVQRQNTSSLFWFLRRLIATRKKHPVFGRGSLKFLLSDNSKVLVYTRCFEDEIILVVINLSKYSQHATIDLSEYKGMIPVELSGKNSFLPISENTPYGISLGPYGFYWFHLSSPALNSNVSLEIPNLKIENWNELVKGKNKEWLETVVIPAYLGKASWYSQQKTLVGCSIKSQQQLLPDMEKCLLLFVELTYRSGFPDLIQLPILFDRGENISDDNTLAFLSINENEGKLVDACFHPAYHHWLIRGAIEGNHELTIDKSIRWDLYSSVIPFNEKNVLPEVRNNRHQQTTDITYGVELSVKLYRVIDPGLHPSAELATYLKKAQFDFVPTPLATMNLRYHKSNYTLAELKQNIPNKRSAYGYFKERIDNYIERIFALRDPEQVLLSLNPDNLRTAFIKTDPALSELLGDRASSGFQLIGRRIAEAHLALEAGKTVSLIPEPFSLHYQNSLYSSLRGLVRRFTSDIRRKGNEDVALKFSGLKEKSEVILHRLVIKKIDAQKIRIHGNFELDRVFFSGKDIYIDEFGGDPLQHLSRRRLKRSPLLDVASFIVSIYSLVYEGFYQNPLMRAHQTEKMSVFAAVWAEFMSDQFKEGYFDAMTGSKVIPAERMQCELMLEIYMLEIIFTQLNNSSVVSNENLTGLVQLLSTIFKKNNL